MPFIQIALNGQPQQIPEGSSVADLLALSGADRQQVAVVVNEHIVRPDERQGYPLHHNDQVDVLVFAGGG
ncbi:MAG: sulfur carrier protein ThiS [Chlorobiaceae bacterium]|nr:sulfur carrier protein ThiS [Chlorobiaceae bacterium]